jgi:hypothetical protein
VTLNQSTFGHSVIDGVISRDGRATAQKTNNATPVRAKTAARRISLR